MGRSGAMLDVVDRARGIFEEYEDEAGLFDDEPELSGFRELLETSP